MTDFPLQVGGLVWIELPHRLRLTLSGGEMPDAYLQTINAIATSAGAYNQEQADFISELIHRAGSWRVQVGWRPFRYHGAYLEGGFGLLTVDKGLALADIIEQATGFPAPREPRLGLGYRITSVAEMVSLELGWIWYPWRNLTVRASLACAVAVDAQVSIKPNFASTLQRPFTRFAEDYGADLIKKYLIIPTVGLAVGWRLF